MKNVDRAKTLRWLIGAAGSEKRNICILTLLQAASGALGVFYALGLRAIVDSAVAKDESKFIQAIVWIIMLVLVQLVFHAWIRYLQEFVNSNLENNLKSRLFDNILRKEFAAVSATHTAEWMNRLTTDTSVIATGAVSILPGACRDSGQTGVSHCDDHCARPMVRIYIDSGRDRDDRPDNRTAISAQEDAQKCTGKRRRTPHFPSRKN